MAIKLPYMESFSGPFGACPGPNKKKEKIGTIFCPKGGLAVQKEKIKKLIC
jgi:hypothetical protein